MKTFLAQAYQPTAVMSSLFAAIGSRLRPDGLQPGNRERGPRSDALKTRRVYTKQFLHELAEEALAFKQDNERERYWRQAFLEENMET